MSARWLLEFTGTRDFSLAGLSKSTCKPVPRGAFGGGAESRFASELVVSLESQVSLLCFPAAVENHLSFPSACFQLPSSLCKKVYSGE